MQRLAIAQCFHHELLHSAYALLHFVAGQTCATNAEQCTNDGGA